MKWRGRRQSRNVSDRRGMSGGKIAIGGGIGGLIIVVIMLLTGQDPSMLLDTSSPPQQQSTQQDDELAQFVAVVLAETEDVWNAEFSKMGKIYEEPQLVLFSGTTRSACGGATAATGPFYCPADHSAYIDLSFYQQLRDRFKAPGDFAMAYVLAHEVGHHVQNLLGISEQVQSRRGRISQEEYNRLSVRLELQADFLAGFWAHHTQRMDTIIEAGDIEEALAAANAIGDDRLQKESQGYVVPDAFTHGTSRQRMDWFMLGWKTGDLSQGDTFKELP